MTDEQRALYDRNRDQIARGFTAFTTVDADGALLGPWGVFIHEPTVGQAHYGLIDAVTELGKLSGAARQVAILTVGGHFKAAYELYAHAAVAGADGLDQDTVATLAAGGRPPNLGADEACAHDVAGALLDGGVLPGPTYCAALDRLGQPALNELVFWVGTYASVCITLNAFDVPSEQTYGDAGAAQGAPSA